MDGWLDLDQWPRRSTYEFFQTYDLPYFSVCAEVDVTRLRAHLDTLDSPRRSVFAATLFLSQQALNGVEAFRLRLRPEGIWRFDRVHAGSTVLKNDETFGFAYFQECDTYAAFADQVARVTEGFKRGDGGFDPRDDDDALIHYSVLPWIRFTGFQHARRLRSNDSVPKIVFGKVSPSGEGLAMPVSVAAHHALADGLHVSRYYEGFQDLLNRPEETLI